MKTYIVITSEQYVEEFKKEDIVKTVRNLNTGKIIFFLTHGIQCGGYEEEIKEVQK